MSGNGFKPPTNVSKIKHKGDPNTATTLDNFKVEREEHLYYPEPTKERFVKCAPYDNHFLYRDPSGKPGRWWAMCTCGSPAVIVGYNAYRSDSSPTRTGELVVCYQHVQTGLHADGSN